MGTIVSLRQDFSFKHLFRNEEVLRHFISDALGIPLEEIRSVRATNTFLWKRFKKQKQGILDVGLELNKPLSGAGRMDDWIQLFNAKTEEELRMLEKSTKNAGILAAVKEVREMSLLKSIRALHEAKLKEISDRNARESYVRKEGIQQGIEQGEDTKLIDLVQRKLRKGKTPGVIAEELDEPLDNVERICSAVLQCGLDVDPQNIYDKM